MRSSRAAVALLVAAAGAAHAQPSPPSDKQRHEAGELVKKAIANSQAGEHDSAIELYLQAYAMIPTPILLSNIGSEYQSENKPTEALKYFCRYLEAEPSGTNVTYATAQAKAIQSQLGNPGLDDKDVCKVKPKPQTESNGSDEGPEGPPPPPPPPRHHHRAVEIAALSASGAGVAAFGVGVYFGLRAKAISDDISSHPKGVAWRSDIVSYEQEGKDDNVRGIAFMIGGGLVAAAGVTTYILYHQRQHEPDVILQPTVTQKTVSLSVSGGF
jgi:hypothetical protein